MTDIGPVQLLAIGFGPDAEYQGQLLDELERLEEQRLVRVLDLLFLGQDVETDELVALDYQGDELGGLVGALLGFAFVGARADIETVTPSAAGSTVGITRGRLEEMYATSIPPSMSSRSASIRTKTSAALSANAARDASSRAPVH